MRASLSSSIPLCLAICLTTIFSSSLNGTGLVYVVSYCQNRRFIPIPTVVAKNHAVCPPNLLRDIEVFPSDVKDFNDGMPKRVNIFVAMTHGMILP